MQLGDQEGQRGGERRVLRVFAPASAEDAWTVRHRQKYSETQSWTCTPTPMFTFNSSCPAHSGHELLTIGTSLPSDWSASSGGEVPPSPSPSPPRCANRYPCAVTCLYQDVGWRQIESVLALMYPFPSSTPGLSSIEILIRSVAVSHKAPGTLCSHRHNAAGLAYRHSSDRGLAAASRW